MDINLKVFSLTEYTTLRFLQGFSMPEQFNNKVAEYLRKEIRNPFADDDKIESYIKKLKDEGEVLALSQTLLLVAPLKAQPGHKNIIDLLLQNGADPKAANASGETGLMLAARVGLLDNVKRLHEGGSDVNQLDLGGRHALFHALTNTYTNQGLQAIQYLFDQNSDPYLINKYGSPLDDFVQDVEGSVIEEMLTRARAKYINQNNKLLPSPQLTTDHHYMMR